MSYGIVALASWSRVILSPWRAHSVAFSYDRDASRAMGKAGRKTVMERFTWEAVAGEMEQEYQLITSGRPTARMHDRRRASVKLCCAILYFRTSGGSRNRSHSHEHLKITHLLPDAFALAGTPTRYSREVRTLLRVPFSSRLDLDSMRQFRQIRRYGRAG